MIRIPAHELITMTHPMALGRRGPPDWCDNNPTVAEQIAGYIIEVCAAGTVRAYGVRRGGSLRVPIPRQLWEEAYIDLTAILDATAPVDAPQVVWRRMTAAEQVDRAGGPGRAVNVPYSDGYSRLSFHGLDSLLEFWPTAVTNQARYWYGVWKRAVKQ